MIRIPDGRQKRTILHRFAFVIIIVTPGTNATTNNKMKHSNNDNSNKTQL
jgi:hypothetical protein